MDRLLDRYPVSDNELEKLLTNVFPFIVSVDLSNANDSFNTFYPDSTINLSLTDQKVLRTMLSMLVEKSSFVLGFDQESEPELYRQAQFLEAVVGLLGRRQVEYATLLFKAASSVSGNKDGINCSTELLSDILASMLLFDQNCELQSRGAMPMISNMPVVTQQEWEEWCESTAPRLSDTMSRVFHALLLNEVKAASRDDILPSVCSTVFPPFCSRQLSMLGVGNYWKTLYDSNVDGSSFGVLTDKLQSYNGPTLVLIHTTKGYTLGTYTSIPWNTTTTTSKWASTLDDSRPGTSVESIVFSLYPYWKAYRRTNHDVSKKCAQFLNYASFGNTNNRQKVKGLAIGGASVDMPRLFIDHTLEHCTASPVDVVLQPGPLLPNEELFFDVDTIVAYAVCDDENSHNEYMRRGQAQRSIKESGRVQAAKVDRTQFVDDFASGAYMNSLYSHRDQARGRADFVANSDSDGDGYYVADKPPSATKNRET